MHIYTLPISSFINFSSLVCYIYYFKEGLLYLNLIESIPITDMSIGMEKINLQFPSFNKASLSASGEGINTA